MLRDNEEASAKMVGVVIGVLVTLIIAVLVFYNIAGSIDVSTADENIRENVYGEGGTTWKNGTEYASNASDDALDQAATFFQIAPIIAIVIVAVVILGYVSRI